MRQHDRAQFRRCVSDDFQLRGGGIGSVCQLEPTIFAATDCPTEAAVMLKSSRTVLTMSSQSHPSVSRDRRSANETIRPSIGNGIYHFHVREAMWNWSNFSSKAMIDVKTTRQTQKDIPTEMGKERYIPCA